MDRRAQKQLAIAFSVIVIIVSTAFLVWRFAAYERASCSDGVKNQNEVDVDCGGVCAPCTALPQAVRLRNVEWIAEEGGRSLDVVFSIENPNLSWGVRKLPYVVAVEGGDGAVLVERRGETFLMPLEVHPVVEQAIALAAPDASLRVRVSLGEPTWVEVPDRTRDAGLVIVDPVLRNLVEGPDAVELRGVVRNGSPFSYDRIEVHVIVRDASGTLVGLRRTEMRTLTAGERRAFRVAWREPLPIVGEPKVETVVLTNVFENENFIRAHGTREPIEPFQRSR